MIAWEASGEPQTNVQFSRSLSADAASQIASQLTPERASSDDFAFHYRITLPYLPPFYPYYIWIHCITLRFYLNCYCQPPLYTIYPPIIRPLSLYPVAEVSIAGNDLPYVRSLHGDCNDGQPQLTVPAWNLQE